MKSNTPTISVIMTFYNCATYVWKAIESILGQTFWDFELIIIDDASSDHSQEVVKKYQAQDFRIQYIKNDFNKGKAYNCNLWLTLSKGTYIAIMDGDDISLSERFEKQLKLFEENPKLDIVWTFQTLIDEKDEKIWETTKPISTKDIAKNAFLFQAMNHPTILVKAEVIKKLWYREEYSEFEDNDLFMRMFFSGYKWYNIPENLYQYRIYSWNVNNKMTRWKALKYFKCQRDVLKLCNHKINLKERMFMYGYLITWLLLNSVQQRWLQKKVKDILYPKKQSN